MSRQDDEMFWLEQAEGIPRSNYNQMWYTWLGDQGYTGTLNERWYKYAGSLGISGSLPDRLKALFCEDLFNSAPPVWILAGGAWNDSGTWQDGKTWSDS